MLFYIALGLACVIAAAVALWIFRSIYDVGKTAYRSILPSSEQKKNDARLAHLNTDLGRAPNPWGWSGTGGARHANLIKDRKPAHSRQPTRRQRRKANGRTPWGWPGSEGVQASNMEILSEGIEKSAAVSSVKKILHADGKPARSENVDWPYEGKQRKPQPVQRSRYVGTTRSSGKAKPWGW